MRIRALSFAVAVCAVGFVAEATWAQQMGTENLYSQYYTQPGASTAHAEMYPAPHPVPRHVGGSYYTYQPLMPHEMMYEHGRNYYNFYASPQWFYNNQCGGPSYQPGYGLNKTTVRWQHGCSHIAPLTGTTHWYNRAANFWNRRYNIKQRPGSLLRKLGAGSGAGCAGGLCSRLHGGAGCANGLCSRGWGAGAAGGTDGGCQSCGATGDWSSDLDGDGVCNSCESFANSWSQARQQAVARTAAAMSQQQMR